MRCVRRSDFACTPKTIFNLFVSGSIMDPLQNMPIDELRSAVDAISRRLEAKREEMVSDQQRTHSKHPNPQLQEALGVLEQERMGMLCIIGRKEIIGR